MERTKSHRLCTLVATLAVAATLGGDLPALGAEQEECKGLWVPCSYAEASCFLEDKFGLEKNDRNYLIFNHEKGIIERPVPAELEARDGEVFTILFACTAPEAFDYKIEAIASDQIAKTTFENDTRSVDVDRLQNAASVTWRHDKTFPLYRVSVTQRKPYRAPPAIEQVRDNAASLFTSEVIAPEQPAFDEVVESIGEGRSFEELQAESQTEITISKHDYDDLSEAVQSVTESIEVGRSFVEHEADIGERFTISPRDYDELADKEAQRLYKLFSYTFPVWVRTVGWQLSFSSGVAFSGLENPKLYLETVEVEGEDGMPAEIKVVRRDQDAEDDFRPDLMALANLRFPTDLGQHGKSVGWLKHFGLSFGVGIGQDSEPRYYFGPSINLGDHFVLTAGWAGGKVETLPTGQRLDQPAINGDSTLSSLPKHFETEMFAGIAFRFRPAEKEFLGALGGVQKVEDGAKEGSKPAVAPAPQPQPSPASAVSAAPAPAPASDGRWRFGSCEPLVRPTEQTGDVAFPQLSGLALAGAELVAPFEERNKLLVVSATGSPRLVEWGPVAQPEIEGMALYAGRYYLVDECKPAVYQVDLKTPKPATALTLPRSFAFDIESKTDDTGRTTCNLGLEGIAIDPADGTLYLLDETDLSSSGERVARIYVGEIDPAGTTIKAKPGAKTRYDLPLGEGWRYSDIVFHPGANGPQLLALKTRRGGYQLLSIPLEASDPKAPKGSPALVLDLTSAMSRGSDRIGCMNPNLEGLTVGPGGEILIVNDGGDDPADRKETVLVRLVPDR